MQNISYCSDKYQYSMGKTFFEYGMKDKIAVFNLFFRQAPDNNNWAVVSGVDEVLSLINNLGKMPEDFFESFIPGDEYLEYRKYLASMKFTGNIYAMREGEIAFPSQPIITIEAPIIEAQVLETPMLSIMNHQMAIATKASRVSRSTNKPVSEFGSRRAHGLWAAVYGAKAAYIGGCVGSSNILSAYKFNMPCSGTMAHSYVTSFHSSPKGEYESFDIYIKTHKGDPLILLIDTYDSLRSGIKNAITAFKANGIDDSYTPGYGIRLDSGDLAYLSNKCRSMLDSSSLKKCKIIATNALDEYLISDLEKQNAAIDSYGVGDAIATSKHNPCFGNVYKLVQLDEKPILKRSEDKIKLINPGFQVTYRIIKDGVFKGDVTCLRNDSLANKIEAREAFSIRDEFDENKTTYFEAKSFDYKILQEKIVDRGIITYNPPHIDTKRNYYISNLSQFNDTQTRIINPHFYKVNISDNIYDLKKDLINNIIKEIEQMDKNVIIKPRTHIVIDMVYDFIDGSLACKNAHEAISKITEYINNNPDEKVLYICDSHPISHCSFDINGGTWPVHCLEGSLGSSLAPEFFKDIKHPENTPSSTNNIFYKGRDKEKEEYSGWGATNFIGRKLEEVISDDIIISGVATEFCVKETVLDLLSRSYNVFILREGLSYLDKKNHIDVINNLESLGAKII